MKRREGKSKGDKERYTHLNAEFQRIARRDKKAFFSDQCKEIEENPAHASLPSPCLLVAGAGVCAASPLGELLLGV